MLKNYKYGITPAELKEARKLIIQDIKSNNKVDNPICNMTLQDYFDMIKITLLSVADENGIVRDWNGETWYSDSRKQDIRKINSVELAKIFSDGRGMFTPHSNNNPFNQKFGDWDNIDNFTSNQGYYPERLNDPNWFKQVFLGGIGAGGHKTELLTCGNFNPIPITEPVPLDKIKDIDYSGDLKWFLSFGTFSRSHYYTLKAYLYMKKKGLPVFIYGAQTYLTNKQLEKLKEEGYFQNKDWHTGY